ncbi:Na+/H+ antiporter [Acetobacter fallax]|uniref:Na+/H+ antiporter n=1 Tax=Acetobacter fallax TaxID=1737473 RepID=A0ABX0KBQ7_9PROT|nr:Na+/H+ antiporter [Acetobacter fallax]NHO32613.1 Na+/H+ antiporter [Acetobacter fallax]NHO36189.1 Na+/H+ antiporter [Acetobacter fallax]
MTPTLIAITLLLVTGLTGALARLLPLAIPLPLLQIAAGTVASVAGFSLPLSSELFLLLLIPPLLFLDAYRIPMREAGELRGIIFSLALGLVVFSAVSGGYFVHWIMPAIPLAAAIALASALSPTDAVSVGSMLSGGKTPARIVQILNGEALLNDASGLVCFKFAVAAATTGLFSLKAASSNFVYVSFGGVLLGAAIAWAFCRLEIWLIRRGYDDPPSHILLSLMLPYVICLTAESVNCSGILAAVAGGMTVRLSGVMSDTQIETRLKATMLWDMVGSTFNGLVFVVLGLQLPQLVAEASQVVRSEGLSPWVLPLTILAIQIVLSVLRAVWITVTGVVRCVVGRLRHRSEMMPSWRGVLVLTLAGTRGAVTLAAIISLPAESDLPGRTVLVVLATGVIITSLVSAAFGLPQVLHLLPQNEGETPAQRELMETRIALTRSAIAALQAEQARRQPDASRSNDAVSLLMTEFTDRLRRLDARAADPDGKRATSVRQKREEVALRLRVLRLQRQVLRSLLSDRVINDVTERAIGRQLDVQEQDLLIEAGDIPRLPELVPGVVKPAAPAVPVASQEDKAALQIVSDSLATEEAMPPPRPKVPEAQPARLAVLRARFADLRRRIGRRMRFGQDQ